MSELVSKTTVEKGHGRIETRLYTASKEGDWIKADKSYPGQPRFENIKTLVRILNRTEYADRYTFDTWSYISLHRSTSNGPPTARAATVEIMHWLLDVEFNDDLSRYRAGHGAKNMSVIRRFTLVRANKSKGSVKTTRKLASWNTKSCK